jgi:tryptophan synthase alpha chain
MSKIKNAFKNKKAFIGFLTAGDPSFEKSEEFIMQMVRGGADLIEIGIPFSDPVAEGIVIQQANIRALKSGTTLNKVFSLVQSVRQKTNIPLVFLTYLNPVFNYGYEAFFAKCGQLGLDGIIIPDLPFEEKDEIKEIALKYDVDIISLIAPTSDERIEKIASESTGFLYIISSMGVTGMRSIITTDISSMIKAVQKTSTIPTAVGFGINTPQQASNIASIADGVIVGSAIVKIIAEHKENAGSYIYEYVKSMKQAIM